MARASSVLPVPGGPISSTPFGMRPPSLVNFFGSLRKAMISSTSSLASSMPATSANVTLCVVLGRAASPRLLPNDIALPPPDLHLAHEEDPHADQQQHREPLHEQRRTSGSPSSRLGVDLDALVAQQLIRSGSAGAKVLKRSPVVRLPWMFCPWIVTSVTSPFSTGHEVAEDDLLVARGLLGEDVHQQQHHQHEE